MAIAAMLESQPSRAKNTKVPEYAVLARGVKRAAAPGSPLSGEKLLALLKFERWYELAELGRDEARLHPLPRGRRPVNAPASRVLQDLDSLATQLIKFPETVRPRSRDEHAARSSMSYDFELAADHLPPTPTITPSDRRDLEAIVTLLELAAICLTVAPGTSFTAEELISEARRLGGYEIDLDETDIRIVLGNAGFLKKEAGGRLRLK